MLAHDDLDGLGRLISVVEGNGGDVVVKNMGLDNAVEKSASDESEFTVNGGSSATSVGPGLSIVVRQGGVGVLQEGNGNEPVVDPEVGDDVPDEQVVETIVLVNPGKAGDDDSKTKITEQD